MIAFDNMRLTTGREMRETALAAAEAGAPQLPAFMLAAQGHIWVTLLRDRSAALPKHVTKFGRPHLLIVSDDPGTMFGMSVGPSGWACAHRLQYFKPVAAIVHASSGNPMQYLDAAEGAYAAGRILMVECGSAQAQAWTRLVERLCPTLTIFPTDGQHPAQEVRH